MTSSMALISGAIVSSVADTVGSIVGDMAELIRYRELLRNLVIRDLKVRYKRSILGFIWTMLNPLLMMVVFTVIFSAFFSFAVKNFTIYFLSAYVLWNFIAQTTQFSMSVLLANSSLLKRIYFPRSIFVVAVVLSGLVNLILAFIPLLFIMLVTGMPIPLTLLFLPIPLLLAALFALGLSLFLSALAIFFYDIIQIYQVLLTAWMYLTPIIYPIEIVPAQYQFLIYLNPLYYLLEAFRAPIYYGVLPEFHFLLVSSVAAALSLIVGWTVFSRNADRFVYYL